MSVYDGDSDAKKLPEEYTAIVEEYENQADQCTIFPAEADQDRYTKWITAEAPAFVHLADHR